MIPCTSLVRGQVDGHQINALSRKAPSNWGGAAKVAEVGVSKPLAVRKASVMRRSSWPRIINILIEVTKEDHLIA
jgi:hypothetical protein